jgi:hypothetical protein
MNNLFPILIFGGFGALVVGLIVLSVVMERKRRQKLALVADQLGLTFEPDKKSPATLGVAGCKLLSRGHARRAYNRMRGTVEDVDMLLFDYQFTTGSGKNSSTHSQTVAAFTFPGRTLPAFELHPEHFFNRIGAALGFDDIDFDTHPEFSKRYNLTGTDESAVRDLFTSAVLGYFEDQGEQHWSIEGFGHWLIVYRPGRRLKPDDWPQFMTDAFGVMNTLTTT